MLQPQTAPPQDEAVEHGKEPVEESEAEAGTHVHDSAPDTPDQLEGAQHVGADEEEDDVFHYQHGKKADTEVILCICFDDLKVCVCVYVYIIVYTCIFIYVYIYIYI